MDSVEQHIQDPQAQLGYRLASSPTDSSSNYVSTADTIQLMRQLVIESVGTPQLQQACQQLLSTCKNPTSLVGSDGEHGKSVCREIFYFVKSKLRLNEDEYILTGQFGYDPSRIIQAHGIELLQSPAYILSLPQGTAQGDCDEYSMLTCAMLLCLGVRNVYFCTVAADGNNPTDFTHVYTKVMLGDRSMYALDTSHGPYPGWETDNVYREQLWSVG